LVYRDRRIVPEETMSRSNRALAWITGLGCAAAVLSASRAGLAQSEPDEQAPPPAAAPQAAPPPPTAAAAPQTGAPFPYPPPAGYQPPPGAVALPPGAQPPPGAYMVPYGYPPPTASRPATLPYEEGQPVPEGYRVVSKPIRGLVIAGSVTTGAMWILGVSIASGGGFANGSGWLVLPVLGPWVAMGVRRSSCAGRSNLVDTATCTADDSLLRTVYVMDGLVQAAGAAMFIAGLAATRTELVRTDMAKVTVTPMPVGSGYGLGAFGRF
jgi:hypothetical protein